MIEFKVESNNAMRTHWTYFSVAATIFALSGGPSLAAGRPDLSGVWQVVGTIKELKAEGGAQPPLKPEAAKLYAKNRAEFAAGNLSYDPTSRCIAPGLPRILTLPYPFEIIQRPTQLVYLFQWNYWNHVVDLTNRQREVPYHLSLGVGKGHFEGNVLVIDTTGLRSDNTLLDAEGMPHSEDLHLVERLRLVDASTLEDRITIEDPRTFSRPWTTVMQFRKLPKGTEIQEDVCLDRTDAGRPAVDWRNGKLP